MHCNPSTYLNSNSSDFPFINPNAGMLRVANSYYAIIRACLYNNFFETPEIFMSILVPLIQVNNRIPDNLTGAMISDIATAIDIINGDMVLIEILLRADQMGFIGNSA